MDNISFFSDDSMFLLRSTSKSSVQELFKIFFEKIVCQEQDSICIAPVVPCFYASNMNSMLQKQNFRDTYH